MLGRNAVPGQDRRYLRLAETGLEQDVHAAHQQEEMSAVGDEPVARCGLLGRRSAVGARGVRGGGGSRETRKPRRISVVPIGRIEQAQPDLAIAVAQRVGAVRAEQADLIGRLSERGGSPSASAEAKPPSRSPPAISAGADGSVSGTWGLRRRPARRPAQKTPAPATTQRNRTDPGATARFDGGARRRS